jgi:acyl-CoA reductase-like NAD-dependent aldehyde dehydrogenase
VTDVSTTIAGERVDAPATFGVVNPATGEVHAEAPDGSREQLNQAFDAAAKAFVDGRRGRS